MAFVSRKMRSPFRKSSPANPFFLLFHAGRKAAVGAARIVGIVSRGFFRGVEDNADNMSVPQLFTGFLRRLGRSRIRANDEEHSIRQPSEHAGVGNWKGGGRINNNPIKCGLGA